MDFITKNDSNRLLYIKKEELLLEDIIKNNENRLKYLENINTKDSIKEKQEIRVIIYYNKKRLEFVKKKIEYWNPKYTRKDLVF